LVTNFNNIKINRVGCGSSQSIAWKCPELPLLMSDEPVKFTRIKDSMGATALSMICYLFLLLFIAYGWYINQYKV